MGYSHKVKNIKKMFGDLPPCERRFLLELMPKNSVSAEVGVLKGDFSLNILDVVNPRKLILINPFKIERGETYYDSSYGGKQENGENIMDRMYSDIVYLFSKKIKTYY